MPDVGSDNVGEKISYQREMSGCREKKNEKKPGSHLCWLI